jgi:ABC-type transport system substrate-binding protein
MTDAVKKYESIPKRKEMITDSMFHYIAKLASRSAKDSLTRAMVDWIVLGCYTGFRKSEWCSDHHDSFDTVDDPNWGDRPTSLPVITNDFSFATESGRRIPDLASSPDRSITFTTLCFRKQKNNDNGQTLTYHHRPDSGWMCPTQASLNIVRRALRLGTPTDHPAAVYLDLTTGRRLQITAAQVAAFLRQVAHKVFNIPAGHKDLLAWSCHSIRVTAANLLHRAKFSDSYIKNRLRWRSDTFLMYLRNTFHTAEQDTHAVTLGLDPPTPDATQPLEQHERRPCTGEGR